MTIFSNKNLFKLYTMIWAFLYLNLFSLFIFALGLTSFLTLYFNGDIGLKVLTSLELSASSVLLSNLFNEGLLPFSSLLAGLSINAGLGPIFLFKKKNYRKTALLIYLGLFILSLVIGYAFLPLTPVLGF